MMDELVNGTMESDFEKLRNRFRPTKFFFVRNEHPEYIGVNQGHSPQKALSFPAITEQQRSYVEPSFQIHECEITQSGRERGPNVWWPLVNQCSLLVYLWSTKPYVRVLICIRGEVWIGLLY